MLPGLRNFFENVLSTKIGNNLFPVQATFEIRKQVNDLSPQNYAEKQ